MCEDDGIVIQEMCISDVQSCWLCIKNLTFIPGLIHCSHFCSGHLCKLVYIYLDSASFACLNITFQKTYNIKMLPILSVINQRGGKYCKIVFMFLLSPKIHMLQKVKSE